MRFLSATATKHQPNRVSVTACAQFEEHQDVDCPWDVGPLEFLHTPSYTYTDAEGTPQTVEQSWDEFRTMVRADLEARCEQRLAERAVFAVGL